MQTAFFKNEFGKIPEGVKRFILRALLFFIGWVLLYHLLLEPAHIPDNQLTNATAWSTTKFTGLFYNEVTYKPVYENGDSFAHIYVNGRRVLNIANGCNALDLMVLYICFLFCVPTNKKRLLFFATIGLLSVFLLNVLRCSSLVWVALNFRQFFDFAHKYLFTAIVYCYIFMLWVFYAKKYTTSAK